jgi:hypothetical protein
MIEIAVALLVGLFSGHALTDYNSGMKNEKLDRVCVEAPPYFIHNEKLYKCKEYK